jgi:hypothetical protein
LSVYGKRTIAPKISPIQGIFQSISDKFRSGIRHPHPAANNHDFNALEN